ncbi:HTH domain-containing protein [Aquicoccus sp. SCR17]|nr:HTH domain-containing protein [Carideicomes alvinocaridis]
MSPAAPPSSRALRLSRLAALLRNGATHRAEDLARATGVTERTIYRDMDRLRGAGFPVAGTRGAGYRLEAEVTLPPLNLTMAELEVLHLGLAVIGRSGEEALVEAARSLSEKVDAALAEETGDAAHRFGHAAGPGSEGAAGLAHMPSVRAAIRARQKLSLTTATGETLRMRPLRLDYLGRVWRLLGWDEGREEFHEIRLDALTRVAVLPELFVDEPGKRARDHRP